MKARSAATLVCALAVLVISLVATTSAQAITFDQTSQAVTGISNSVWSVGSSGQTYGTNCSTAILGSSYPEVMEMAYSRYGGTDGSVRVGDQYWAMIHLAVTGNPCPKGSDIIAIDLAMPPGTSFDATRPIRCFSTNRHSTDYYESTNQTWDMRPIGINAYGRTCPTGLTPSATGHGVGLDFRGLANGQNFLMYVPVKSAQPLIGMGNGDHRFVWLVSPSLAYDYFGTTTWANVFSTSTTTPYVFYTRDPSVVPYWDNSAPAGEENRVKIFASVFTGYKAGDFCLYVHHGTNVGGGLFDSACTTLPNSPDSFYLYSDDPNDGVKISFDPVDYGKPFTVQWKFTPTGGGGTYTSDPLTFTTLSGPDQDQDGVANDGTDLCPTAHGNPPNGCPPPMSSADSDGDGVPNTRDACPNVGQFGAANGCPTLTAGLGKLPSLKRGKLAKGVSFPVTCSLDTPVSAKLTVKKSVAKKLKLKVKKGAKSVTIATAKGNCTAKSGAKLKLKLSSKAKKPVSRSKKSISASLSVTFTPAGGVAPTTTAKSVKLK